MSRAGAVSRMFRRGTRLWPPARHFAASPCCASWASASSTERTAVYSKTGGFTGDPRPPRPGRRGADTLARGRRTAARRPAPPAGSEEPPGRPGRPAMGPPGRGARALRHRREDAVARRAELLGVPGPAAALAGAARVRRQRQPLDQKREPRLRELDREVLAVGDDVDDVRAV